MNKILKISIIILIVLIIIVFSYYPIKKVFANMHNAKISKTCETDSDCVIKTIGCSCCGYAQGCVNKDSVDFVCAYPKWRMNCECIPERVRSCTCHQSECIPSNALE